MDNNMIKCPNCGMTIFAESNNCGFCDYKIDHPENNNKKEEQKLNKKIVLSNTFYKITYIYKLLALLLLVFTIYCFFNREVDSSNTYFGIIHFNIVLFSIAILCLGIIFQKKGKCNGYFGELIGVICGVTMIYSAIIIILISIARRVDTSSLSGYYYIISLMLCFFGFILNFVRNQKDNYDIFEKIYKFFSRVTFGLGIIACILIIVGLKNSLVQNKILIFIIYLLAMILYLGELYISKIIINSKTLSENMKYGILSSIITIFSSYIIYRNMDEEVIIMVIIPIIVGLIQLIMSIFVKKIKKKETV